MSNKQINQFPLTTTAQPNDYAHIVRGGEDRSILISDLVPVIGDSVNAEVQELTNNVDFVGGFSDVITLSTPVSDKSLAHIFFDGLYQEKDTYEINSIVVTFNETIPAHIKKIEVITPLSLPLANVNANDIQFKDGFTYSWPLADGETNAVLSTNGSGELSWKAPTDLPRYGWKEKGSAADRSFGTDPMLAALTATRIVTFVGNSLRAYDFDGTTWVQVGNDFPTGETISFPALCSLSATDILVENSDSVKRYTFDGTNFSLVGNPFTLPVAAGTRPAATKVHSSSTRALFFNPSADEVYLLDHNGTDWTILDTMVGVSTTAPSCTTLTDGTIVLQSQGHWNFRFFRIVSNIITLVDTIETTFPLTGVDSIAAFSATDFVHADEEGKLTVFRWRESEGTIRQIGPSVQVADTGRVAITELSNATIVRGSDTGNVLQSYTFDYYSDVPTITGSRGGNAALASILTALDDANLIIDNTTA